MNATHAEPIRVFLSYAGDDAPMAHRLAEALEAQGLEVQSDWKIPADGQWRERLGELLEQSPNIVLLFTPTALTSRWANFEMGVALGRAHRSPALRIVPVLVGVASERLPAFVRSRNHLVRTDAEHLDEAGSLIVRQLLQDEAGEPSSPAG